MAPELILVVAGLSTAWAVLTLIGSERQNVLQRAECQRGAEAAADAKDNQPAKAATAVPKSLGKSSK